MNVYNGRKAFPALSFWPRRLTFGRPGAGKALVEELEQLEVVDLLRQVTHEDTVVLLAWLQARVVVVQLETSGLQKDDQNETGAY